MIGSAFLLAYCGLSGLAASQAQHRKQLLKMYAGATVPMLLRVVGAVALVLSLWICISLWPVDEGIVAWIMLLAVAGLLVVAVLAFAAGWFWWIATAAALASVAVLMN